MSGEKLFIGQVPKTMLEEELKSLFTPFGHVIDITIIRDKETKNHKGCAFVTFSTQEETTGCILGLHNKINLPGMSNTMQVKYAGENPRAASAAPTTSGTSHKLFIGMLPKTYSEDDLRPMFEPFGEIKDMNVLRGADGISKGCAFILFKEIPSAISAITTLNGKVKLDGAPSSIVVSFATSDKNRQGGPAPAAAAPMMSGGIFLPQSGFMDPYAGISQASLGGYGSNFMLPQANAAAATTNALKYYGYNAPTPAISSPNAGLGSNKEGPPGANLFIYHLPKEYSDASLMAMYSQFGAVLSCKVVTDKETGQSKGFGFVSYEHPDSAQIAILNTNGLQLHGGKRLKVEVKASKAASRPY